MKSLPFDENDLPVSYEVDIAVVGGGTAGAFAGIAAARSGKRTLIIENQGFLGGSQTGGLVTPEMPVTIKGKSLITGLNSKINKELAKTGDAATFSDGNDGWFNPEALKFVLEQMYLGYGGRILFYTRFIQPLLKNDRIESIIIFNKNGFSKVNARMVIDASGDAEVAFSAGADCDEGDNNGIHQPMSLRFIMGNVNIERFLSFARENTDLQITELDDGFQLFTTAHIWDKGWQLESLFRKAVDEGILEHSDGDYFQIFSIPGRPGEIAFNCPRIPIELDGANAEDLTYVQIEGKKAIRRISCFCKKYLPGFDNAFISQIAPFVGIRETRRIRGEYCLTADDVINAVKFPDAVARNNYPIDIHKLSLASVELLKLKSGEYYEIPYRCLVPLKIDNLLVAGRCISTTFEAQGSIRIQPVCRALGEAAGIAAAICIDKKVVPRRLDGTELRKVLIDSGANL